jgi:hypothetical protein
MDTSTFTHFYRAGYGDVLGLVAPGAIVLVPREVEVEIERARERHTGVPTLDQVSWAQRTFLSEDEDWTAMQVKAALGGGIREHLGECAVIACAHHRGLVAVLDDAAAVHQAEQYDAAWTNTIRIAAKIHGEVYGGEKTKTIALVDALLDTDMRLPVTSGAQLFE